MQDAIAKYVALLQAQSDALENEYQKQNYSVTFGAVWAKVWYSPKIGAGQSIHTFIRLATGDIYFASSCKQPSKRIVGNVNNPNPLQGTNLHGGDYANQKTYTYTGSDSL